MKRHITLKRIQITNHFKFVLIFLVLIMILLACKKSEKIPDPLEAGWNNQAVCELVKKNEKLRVLKCTFKSGECQNKHYHDTHFGYALSGSTFRIKDKNDVREIKLATGSHFDNEGV